MVTNTSRALLPGGVEDMLADLSLAEVARVMTAQLDAMLDEEACPISYAPTVLASTVRPLAGAGRSPQP